MATGYDASAPGGQGEGISGGSSVQEIAATDSSAGMSSGGQGLSHLGGGVNQAGGRAYNERLTLSLIRLNGPLPKAELARLTGLTVQTITQIIRRLEAEGLVVANAPVRGRVGQPYVPFALNPLGALSFGVKIGRRSTEIVLCDLAGSVIGVERRAYAYPVPEEVFRFVTGTIQALRKGQDKGQRYAGIGVAVPFDLWKWAAVVDAPAGVLEGWRDLDLAAALRERTGLATFVANDATAACGAELAYVLRGQSIDMMYLFVGSFAGGGVVLNGVLQHGRTGNAGALGSMPVTVGGRGGQLIHHASLLTLERAVARAGGDATIISDPDNDWNCLGATLDHWIANAADALAQALVAGASVFDFGHMRIDGAVPRAVLFDLVEATRRAIGRHDLQGLSPFVIEPGGLGADARALGGAMLPLFNSFAAAQDVLLKDIPRDEGSAA